MSQRHQRHEINGFVIFSTVGVFLVTVTPAADFDGHGMFMIFSREHLWRYDYDNCPSTSTSGTVPIWRKSAKIQRNQTLFHGGVELWQVCFALWRLAL
jgi:hypothetical protein